jgi:hypothetical protein
MLAILLTAYYQLREFLHALTIMNSTVILDSYAVPLGNYTL